MTKKPAKFIGTLGYERPESIRFEYNSGEVVTVEGEALTIQEIFERNLNNHDPLVARLTYYEETEDFDFPDLSKVAKLDLFEQAQLYREVETKASEARKAIEEHRRKQEKEEARLASERSVESESGDSHARVDDGSESEQ